MSVGAVYVRVWRRQLPVVRIGRSIRFDPEDIEELIERGRTATTELARIPRRRRRQAADERRGGDESANGG